MTEKELKSVLMQLFGCSENSINEWIKDCRASADGTATRLVRMAVRSTAENSHEMLFDGVPVARGSKYAPLLIEMAILKPKEQPVLAVPEANYTAFPSQEEMARMSKPQLECLKIRCDIEAKRANTAETLRTIEAEAHSKAFAELAELCTIFKEELLRERLEPAVLAAVQRALDRAIERCCDEAK